MQAALEQASLDADQGDGHYGLVGQFRLSFSLCRSAALIHVNTIYGTMRHLLESIPQSGRNTTRTT
jgi:hypothetical protein